MDKNIEEHEQKLEDYQKDPEKHDNKGQLKNAPTPASKETIKQGRVDKLKKEINKFKNEKEKMKDKIEELKKQQEKQKQSKNNDSKQEANSQ